MDLLVTALKALAAQQSVEATKRTARGGLMAAAMFPLGVGVLLIAVAFLAYAAYAALLPSWNEGAAAAVVAAGLLVVTLCIFLIAWLISERGKAPRAAEPTLDPMMQLLGTVIEDVRANPGSTMALAALAGAFVSLTMSKKR